MVTSEDIKTATAEFFACHWNSERLARHKLPQWSGEYRFLGVRPEGREMQGCYAFLEGEQVVYIGSAVSRGRPPYEEYGIGARLNQYTTWDRDKGLVEGKRVYRIEAPIATECYVYSVNRFSIRLGIPCLSPRSVSDLKIQKRGIEECKER